MRADQRVIGVVDVEQHRGVLVALERERQLGPIVVPCHHVDVDADVGMDLLVLLDHLVDRVGGGLPPRPVLHGDRLSVIDQMVGVVGNGVAHHLEALVRLGIDHRRVFGGTATGKTDDATGCNECRHHAFDIHGRLLLRKTFIMDNTSICHRFEPLETLVLLNLFDYVLQPRCNTWKILRHKTGSAHILQRVAPAYTACGPRIKDQAPPKPSHPAHGLSIPPRQSQTSRGSHPRRTRPAAPVAEPHRRPLGHPPLHLDSRTIELQHAVTQPCTA